MPPSGTAISAIAAAMTSELLSASQKSVSSKMKLVRADAEPVRR